MLWLWKRKVAAGWYVGAGLAFLILGVPPHLLDSSLFRGTFITIGTLCLIGAAYEWWWRKDPEMVKSASLPHTPGMLSGEETGVISRAVLRQVDAEMREMRGMAPYFLPPPPQTPAEPDKPYVVVTHVTHPANDIDRDGKPFYFDYLRFHNVGPEAALGVTVDAVTVYGRTFGIFEPVRVLDPHKTEDRQLSCGFGSAFLHIRRIAGINWAAEIRIPLTVRYHDRVGRQLYTQHAIIAKGSDIHIEDIEHKRLEGEYAWTKFPENV